MTASVVTVLALVFSAHQALALPFTLDTAGPESWTILELGNGNVSLANAGNSGVISGNLGVNGKGNISDGGNLAIKGDVYLCASSQTSGLSGNISGTTYQDADSVATLLRAATDATNASIGAAGLAASGGGVGVSSITSGQTLTPGVYNLSELSLNNGEQLILTGAGADAYVFNISGSLSLQSAQIIISGGMSERSVLFNITGSQAVQFSGGLNDPHGAAELHGIILALNANVQVTPGKVVGEIIGGKNINLSGGASVENVPHPAFFNGETNLGGGIYYLTFPDGTLFGYYTYAFFPYLYHFDLGFEYFIDADDSSDGAYLYDFTSGHWWYTSPSAFPFIYDFTLDSWLYYFPNTNSPGHYTSNPREFYDLGTSQYITL